MIRIAHISDLHFFSLPKTLKGFLGKNGVGVLNHLLFRKKFFHSTLFKNLIADILEKNVEELWISGDLSVSGLEEEFILAKEALFPHLPSSLKILVIPGNHDVRSNLQNHIAKLFLDKDFCDPVETHSLNEDWDLITLDASHNGHKRDSGLFSESLEEMFEKHITASIKDRIAVLCHYPPPIAQGKNNRLVRGEALQHLLSSHPKIALFAHGHTHNQTLFQLKSTLVTNPGISRGSFGRYNFYELGAKTLKVELRSVEKKNSLEGWYNKKAVFQELTS